MGFELAHVGINCESADESLAVCEELEKAFDFEVKTGNSSNFASTGVEVMKTMFKGANGHIAIRTNKMTPAIAEMEKILEMIRSENEFSDVSVIFLTGKDDKQTVMDVMNLKPDGYLLKTMKPYLIVKAVDEFFAKKKMKG